MRKRIHHSHSDDALKLNQFLANIREKLKNLPYNSIELQKITMYINEQDKSLNAPVTRRTIQSNFAVKHHEKCKDCAECTNTNLEVKTSLRRPTEFLEAITPLVKAFKDPYYEQKLLQY